MPGVHDVSFDAARSPGALSAAFGISETYR